MSGYLPHDYAYERLTSHFKTTTLKGFGIENLSSGIIAAGAILYYLEETEHKEVGHISSISRIEEEKYVWLDKFTIRNLELIFPQQEGVFRSSMYLITQSRLWVGD
jgi:DNA mismatch repair protein MutS